MGKKHCGGFEFRSTVSGLDKPFIDGVRSASSKTLDELGEMARAVKCNTVARRCGECAWVAADAARVRNEQMSRQGWEEIINPSKKSKKK